MSKMNAVQQHLQSAISELSQVLQQMIVAADSNAATTSQISQKLIGVISTLSTASILTTDQFRKRDVQDESAIKLITDLRQTVERQKLQLKTQAMPTVEVAHTGVNTMELPEKVRSYVGTFVRCAKFSSRF
jgi:hypothetical protein